MNKKFKEDLIEYSMTKAEPYSEFQMQNFVVNQEITDYRKLRQIILEIETRRQAVETLEMEIEKNEIWIEQAEEEHDNIYNDSRAYNKYEKRLDELKIKRLKYDYRVNKKRYKQGVLELDVLVKLVEDSYENIESVRDQLENNIEGKEQIYWISRLGKQASMDLISTGRIGVGNMDAIANMSEKNQVKTLKSALEYTDRLSSGMKEIGDKINKKLIGSYDMSEVTGSLDKKQEEK
jgi:hypothetical protein